MKRLLPFLLILLVAGGAVVAATLFYRAHREPAFAPIPGELSSTHPGAQPPHYRGAPDAPVVLEEFADLQCPPCAALSVLLKKIAGEKGKEVRVVFRQFPLAMHNHAMEAARATEAAARQNRFWEMSDKLYENQATWSKEASVTATFERYAKEIGLNLEKYNADRTNDALVKRIEADQQRGKSLGVTATPTLFINNQRVPQQSMNDKAILGAIQAIIDGKPPFPKP